MSRFLVTGATGFIGSAIIRHLATNGHEGIALETDLLRDDHLDLSSIGASHCIHAAWYTNHTDYLVHAVNRDWVSASCRLAEAFDGRFVGLGTCLEYDVADAAGSLPENTPLRPETLYAQSKVELFERLSASAGNFAWARVFFVYGPGDRTGRLIPQMIGHFLQGKAAGPTSGGLRRDYCHVDDIAGQLVRIAMSDVRGAINTGTGAAPTLSEIYAAGAHAFGQPRLALANSRKGGQPALIQADLTHFRSAIGDPNARDIKAGLRDLVG